MKTAIQSPLLPPAIGPYSPAVRSGSLLFLSGQIPVKADGTLVTGSVEEQTQQVMKNLETLLTAAKLSFQAVVKTTIYLANMDDFAAVNKTYESFLTAPFPARATVQVARLPKNVAIEIDMIATYD